ncbi:MAG: hypothetical protein GXO23_04025 [Crenarchaeota archaeon]|nr:hypothetical protein [Thermoproteota archaeon]
MALVVLRGSAKTCIPVDYFIDILKKHNIECVTLCNTIICVGEGAFIWASNIEKILEEDRSLPIFEDEISKAVPLIVDLLESVARRDYYGNIRAVREIINQCINNTENALFMSILLKDLENVLRSSYDSCIILKVSENKFLKILIKKCNRVRKIDFIIPVDLKDSDNTKRELEKITNIFNDLGIREIRYVSVRARL